jgi:hypothetical protein
VHFVGLVNVANLKAGGMGLKTQTDAALAEFVKALPPATRQRVAAAFGK